MTTLRVRGLIVVAGVTGLLAFSAGLASASVNTPRTHPDGSVITVVWEGPTTEAYCQATAASESKESYVEHAACIYRDTNPITILYQPGWYNYEAIYNSDY
jgi:hypothetical protein